MGLRDKLRKMTGGVDSQLLEGGRPGRAIIVEFGLGGTTMTTGNAPKERVCNFLLEVALDDTPRYQAKVSQRIPEYAIAQIQPGHTVVAVRVDPNDDQRVAIDFEHEAPTVEVTQGTGELTAADILAQGQPVSGVIVTSEALGMKNKQGVDIYAFVLTLLPEGAPPEQIQVGFPVPDAAKPLLYPGSKVRAKWIPNNHQDVVVDWDATLASPPA